MPQAWEITELLNRIHESEDFIQRAEKYFREHHEDWSDGVIARFEIFLERKREQVHNEWHLLEQLGWKAALEESQGSDI